MNSRDKPVNILKNISTLKKAVKIFQKPIKRMSLESTVLLRNQLSLIQRHSQDCNSYGRDEQISQNQSFNQQDYHPQTEQLLNMSLGIQINENKDKINNQEKVRKGVLLKRASIVVSQMKKNVDFVENLNRLEQNYQILNYFYEQYQDFDKFNHQYVNTIQQGKLITDEVNYDNKYDPSAVRTMSAIVSQDNTYIISIDYSIYNSINQKKMFIKQKQLVTNLFLANGFQEKQTRKFLKSAIVHSKILRFQKNDFIYQQNDNPQYFYFLIKGELQICLQKQNKRIQLLQIQGFTSFGEFSALSRQPYSHSALCLNYCKVLAIELPILADLLKHRDQAHKELIMKSRNLNTYICSRIETYSDSKRDLSFKGDVIYQRPLVSQKQGQISFNDFNNILTEFGGESIIQSPTYHTTSKKEKKQCQDLNQYQVKSQKSYSEHLAQEEAIKKLLLEKKTNQPNQQNQCTIQLRNKTVRSLYYDQKEANQSEQSNLDQLIQMSFHLGYKKTHQVTKLNQRALKNNQELNLQNCLVQNLFCTKSPQNFRNKIDQFEIRRRFDNYTFRLEKTERSSSSTKQSNKKKVLKFLDEHSQRSVEISDSFDSNECVQNNFMKRQTSNKTLNIHTQVKKQINRFVTPREQKEFKSTLQSFSNQQRVLNESLAFGNTTQQSINMNSPISKESKEYLLQLIEKPHQKELRNRIASFIKQKEQIKDIQKQADPQLRITKSFLSQKQIKQRTDNQLQSPLFNPNFSQIQNNTSYQAENISQICFLKGGLSVDGNSEDFSQFDSINNKQPEQNKTQTSYFLSKSYSNKSNPFLKKILNNQQKKYQNTISKNFENKINDSDLQLKDIFNTTNLSKINESTPMKRQDSLSDFLKISQIIESPKQPKFIQKINIIQ